MHWPEQMHVEVALVSASMHNQSLKGMRMSINTPVRLVGTEVQHRFCF